MSLRALTISSVIYLLLIPWLDCKITVAPGRVRIARRLCRVPYYWYTGQSITDVCYDSDWDDEDTATGVVVSIDSKQFHIVAPRQKTAFYRRLLLLMRTNGLAPVDGVAP
ncbi:hypothetical protein [Pseudoduganella armeniaca]|uniref:Uncharacterized protein n=1 Tax=Pseudoduganella armeniaca TaxID=2072590 RepID=A0A2R4CCF1_9BURK|nr:hypothetical protein [Pseudoduganella armeniaca]AVR97307.1 hypothetical protein C9I28_17895 [Pseudoduganella armeniaca]